MPVPSVDCLGRGATRGRLARAMAELTDLAGWVFSPTSSGASFGRWISSHTRRHAPDDRALFGGRLFCFQLVRSFCPARWIWGSCSHRRHIPTSTTKRCAMSAMISSLRCLRPDRDPRYRSSYIVPDYSPAFLRLHAERLPRLSTGLVTTAGQSNACPADDARNGAGRPTSPKPRRKALDRRGVLSGLEGAPTLGQPVYGAVHIRNRHRKDASAGACAPWRRRCRP